MRKRQTIYIKCFGIKEIYICQPAPLLLTFISVSYVESNFVECCNIFYVLAVASLIMIQTLLVFVSLNGFIVLVCFCFFLNFLDKNEGYNVFSFIIKITSHGSVYMYVFQIKYQCFTHSKIVHINKRRFVFSRLYKFLRPVINVQNMIVFLNCVSF